MVIYEMIGGVVVGLLLLLGFWKLTEVINLRRLRNPPRSKNPSSSHKGNDQ